MDNKTTFLVCCAIHKTLEENNISCYHGSYQRIIDHCLDHLRLWTAESVTWARTNDPEYLKEITDAICLLVTKGQM